MSGKIYLEGKGWVEVKRPLKHLANLDKIITVFLSVSEVTMKDELTKVLLEKRY